MEILKSNRLDALRYDIRGPVYEKALQLQSQGYKITSLNIGNPAAFGFETPDEIIHDIIMNIRNAQGYADSRGLFAARKAVMQYYQSRGVRNTQIEDVFIGNGVSELIALTMTALLNNGDEILIPSPDYPLWTTSVGLAGGTPVHYICDEASDWNPDLEDIEAKITKKTRGIVLINPNNPTGAVYEKEIVEKIVRLAEKYKLIVFADEIYDKILFDGAVHHTTAGMSEETLIVTMGGMSKNYRAAGFRGGWMILTGAKHKAKSYIEGLSFMASMRLCANVITQYGIQTALGGYQSINDLVVPTGRLYKQMQLSYDKLVAIPGVSCVKPKGAMYLFPKIDLKEFNFKNDGDFVLSLLEDQRILVVAGQGFNYKSPDHFRVVFLPHLEQLNLAMDKISMHFENSRKTRVKV
ncbi:alanine-synthesizing transaminase [Pseudarcicella hirudinis]|uniref:alanine transaminase n=1 Tax=Pseudarcicella hirudinis TaxID=1079859 RepID=A0A1I5Y908_9BACT|nr:pyridoxal phosphate-dependent aminotransferase [Pseudarcicella hirudinis]SFQ40590.1 alanine-synthesizing transaminase [Pseudarcicella hirudinis]